MTTVEIWLMSIYLVGFLCVMVYGFYTEWHEFLKPNTDIGSLILVFAVFWFLVLIVGVLCYLGEVGMRLLHMLTYGKEGVK